MRATVKRSVEFTGVGVHGGSAVRATVRPARAGTGIKFLRTDRIEELGEDGARIPARFDAVVDTRLCTVLGAPSGATISTVEHLMAALAGLGVTDAEIAVDGPEIPIMDGSSEPFVRALSQVGLKPLKGALKAIRIARRVEVRRGDAMAALEPCDRFEMRFSIDFAEPAIGRQERSATLVNGAFVSDLCRARTFGRLQDVEMLRKMGLARGGSLDNAIVVDGARILNQSGLRFDDEFVRHKMLDAVGDLALAGAPIQGRYTGVCAGHEMTNLLLRALFDAPDAWGWVEQDAKLRLGLKAPTTAALTPAAA